MYALREATGEDVHYILDMDIKCFDDPWPAEHWRMVGSELNIVVATYYGTPIGMVVFAAVETEDGLRYVSMTKLAVKKPYRNRGIGQMLLSTVETFGRQEGITRVMTVVPETSGAVDWLVESGFKAVGVSRLSFTSYGVTEDGIQLERQL